MQELIQTISNNGKYAEITYKMKNFRYEISMINVRYDNEFDSYLYYIHNNKITYERFSSDNGKYGSYTKYSRRGNAIETKSYKNSNEAVHQHRPTLQDVLSFHELI